MGGRHATQAVDLLEKASELGEPAAMDALAYLYRSGIAVDIDHERAKALFRAAAEQDHAESLYFLGEYAMEEGDYVAALGFFQRSGDLGYLLGAYREGQLLETGVDEWLVPRSCSAAVRAYKVREPLQFVWSLREARERGHPSSGLAWLGC